MNNNKKNSKLYLLILIGMLASLGPFVTDFYLPALPELNTFFGTMASLTQLSLTFCMLGLAIGQLFVGPISDKFGRKPPLLISLVLFIASTVACIFAWDIESFIFFRFIQGLAGAGGIVISRSIAVDLYEDKELARFFTLLSVVQAIAPVLSPVLGGMLLNFTDWKGIFFALILIEIVLLLLLFPFKESLPHEKQAQVKVWATFKNYPAIFQNRNFMQFVLIQSLAMGVMFAYIASSAFIFQQVYGLSPFVYSLCFGVNAVSILLGNLITNKFNSIEHCVTVGAWGFTVIGILTALAVAMQLPLIVVEGLLFCFLFCLGMILPTTTTLAMNLERANSGSASAVLGFMTFLGGGIASPLTGLGNMFYSTGIVFAVCCMGVNFFTHRAIKSGKEKSTADGNQDQTNQ